MVCMHGYIYIHSHSSFKSLADYQTIYTLSNHLLRYACDGHHHMVARIQILVKSTSFNSYFGSNIKAPQAKVHM